MESRHESTNEEHPGAIDPAYPGEPEQPNAPDVAGTSFPLLSTVLAGFSITIAVQLILSPDPGESLSRLAMVGLVMVIISALLFLSSTGFALNAQANNYLPFLDIGERAQQLLRIDDHRAWVRRIALRWRLFYSAAVSFFFLGAILLFGGINVIVWERIGGSFALILLIVLVTNIVIVGALTGLLYRRSNPADEHPEAGATDTGPGDTRE